MEWNSLSTNITTAVYYLTTNQHCHLCHAPSKNKICEYCLPYINFNESHCKQCARPTKAHHILCGHCQKNHPQQHITKTIAPFEYQDLVAHLIKAIKFQQQTHFIRTLLPYLTASIQRHYETDTWPTEIIPVPSHPKRIRQRGFCHTQLIAKLVQQHLQHKIKINSDSLIKSQYTPAQHTLKRKERLKTQKNTYQIINKVAKHIVLIDDVITTGSTVNACATELFKHGVERIDVWAFARTP